MPQSLLQKLRIRPGDRIAVLNAPDAATGLMLRFPLDVDISHALSGSFRQIHCFVATRRELEACVPQALPFLEETGIFWVYFPKGTSGTQRDLTRDRGWNALPRWSLRHVGLISLDDTWSAIALRRKGAGAAPRPASRSVRDERGRVIDRVRRTANLPPDAKRALARSSGGVRTFGALSYTHRKECVEWIVEAKRPETRVRRIAELVRRLTSPSKRTRAGR